MGLLKEKEKHLWLVQLPGEGRSSFREKGGRDGDRSGRQRVGRVGFAGKTMEGAEQASVTGFADLHFSVNRHLCGFKYYVNLVFITLLWHR